VHLKVDPTGPGIKILNWWSQFGLENDKTWIRALIVILLLSFTVPVLAPLNHDVGWHLYAAERILAGDRLYVDLIEYNPPFVYYFNVPVVALAQMVGIPASTAFLSLVILLALVLYYFSFRLLSMVAQNLATSVPRVLLLSFICLTVPYVAFEFGQREHLLVLLLFPYVLILAARILKRPLPGWMPLAAGLTGAIGLAFKPQFLLVWLLLETYAWAWEGIKPPWRRQESLLVCSFFFLYGLSVVLFMRDYFSVIEMAASTYPNFDTSPWENLGHSARFPLLALAAYLVIRSNQKNRVLCRLLLFSMLGSWAIAVASQKGWFYHFIPAHVFAALLLVLLLMSLVDTRQEACIPIWEYAPLDKPVLSLGNVNEINPYQRFISFVVLVFFLNLTTNQVHRVSLRLGSSEYSTEGQIVELIRNEGTRQNILFFSTSMFPAFPVVNRTQSRWGMRFPFLWFIPGLYPAGFIPRTEDSMSETERHFFQQIVDDFLANSPQFVFTDDRIKKQGIGENAFDYLDYFSQDPRFAEDWKNHRLMTIAGTYRVFRRDDARGEDSVPGQEGTL